MISVNRLLKIFESYNCRVPYATKILCKISSYLEISNFFYFDSKAQMHGFDLLSNHTHMKVGMLHHKMSII